MSTKIMTPQEVAEYLGVTIDTLNSWRKSGTGPAYRKINQRVIRYSAEDVEAWLEDKKVDA